MAKKPTELTKWLGIRLNLTDYNKVKEHTDKVGIPISMFIRNLIRKEMER